ncbi:hypothetical protein [Planctomyces sp. SH-PL62]|uniref:hypothetical protein n=1 Tax=Planctomyces sp. SH-PL62 TaxID=1636152 RepID=UPI00078E47DF|nr:hypothetical protein [Planctomyces sp. SH-PL62]AMV35848.1 hypothetical protein VT85_00290 [Planctomyces sp. SH-PL62]
MEEATQQQAAKKRRRLSIDGRLLAIIGRRTPAIYDIIPQGPLSYFSRVALNPQPLPPHELGAAIASEFIRIVWLSERFGQDLSVALRDLEDWCPTPPRPPKFPPWWPPIPIPDPHPDWLTDYYLGFATRLAAATAGADGLRLGETLAQALDRSVAAVETAISRAT